MSRAFLATSLIIIATSGTGAILTIAAGIRVGKRLSLVTAFSTWRSSGAFALGYVGIGVRLANTHR